MSDYEFTLPYPPSVNAWETPFRGRMILTKKGREYRTKNKDACDARSRQWMIGNHEYRIAYQKSRRVNSAA